MPNLVPTEKANSTAPTLATNGHATPHAHTLYSVSASLHAIRHRVGMDLLVDVMTREQVVLDPDNLNAVMSVNITRADQGRHEKRCLCNKTNLVDGGYGIHLQSHVSLVLR